MSLLRLIFEGSNLVVLSTSPHCPRYVGISPYRHVTDRRKACRREKWPIWVILQDRSSNFLTNTDFPITLCLYHIAPRINSKTFNLQSTPASILIFSIGPSIFFCFNVCSNLPNLQKYPYNFVLNFQMCTFDSDI